MIIHVESIEKEFCSKVIKLFDNFNVLLIIDDEYANCLIDIISSGFCSLILKNEFLSMESEIIDVIKSIEKDSIYISQYFKEVLELIYISKEMTLTKREVEIVRLISTGLTNSEIADILYLSSGTVRNHISNIFVKLNVNNRVEIVAKYYNIVSNRTVF